MDYNFPLIINDNYYKNISIALIIFSYLYFKKWADREYTIENCILLSKGINEFVVFHCIVHVWF